MPVTDPTATVVVDLSRAEQWVLHHALLDTVGPADESADTDPEDEPRPALDVVEKLEAGTFEFTREELDLVRRTCRAHARATDATADRNLASAVDERIGAALEGDAGERTSRGG